MEKLDPRQLKELTARFNYDVRNKGAGAAVDAMFERNAKRREIYAKEAKQKSRDFVENNVNRELEAQRRKRQIFS